MRRFSVLAAVAGLVLASMSSTALAANGHANARAVCPGPPAGHAHCHALVVTDARGNPRAATAPTGLAPATIKSVYGFPTSGTAGTGQTIAIVDAYDDPTAEQDLATFSAQFGLPSCTTANGCFAKVDQTGGTSYPAADQGWALEISLDVQWAHAVAPGAKILLVEAASNNFADLFAAVGYAKAHAQYVSNSWGAAEFSGETLYDGTFVQKGVSFFVSAGDNALPAEYPSSSPNVVSVGGTRLTFNPDGSLASETGWSLGGGGCSTFEAATPAQSGFGQYGQAGCGGSRATPDVALDADPDSGVAVYDSTPYFGQTGWFTVGGTSASSPMWAARAADSGAVVDAAYVYGSAIAFRDITSGNNGAPCLTGYDLCSGRGSWIAQSAPAAPSISSIGPLSGPVGTTVRIDGSGFTGATAVAFAGTPASFTVVADGRIDATVPAGATDGAISVTTPAGSATSASSFTVTQPEAGLAVAYQIGTGHTGFQTDPTLTTPFAQRWTVSLQGAVSYPLIADGKVFVTAANPSSYGSVLYALDQATGSVVWSEPIAGTYFFSASAYDNGQVFVVDYDGLLHAFDAGTGALNWSNQLPGQWAFTSPPTAAKGVVYVGGAGYGGTLYAVDELSGGLLATESVTNGDHSSPALSDSGVFVSYACNQADGFAQTTLDRLWHYSTSCEGGGGKTVVVAGGRVYTRDFNGNLVLDSSTGGLLGSWTPAGATALAPAFDPTTLYALTGSTLTAQSIADGSPRWTFTGDGKLDTAPLVIANGSRELVVEGSGSGALYALDAATGGVLWQGNAAAAISKPDEQNAVQLTGLAAGRGLLVVPAGSTVTAFAAAPTVAAPTVGSFTPTSGPVGTTVTVTGSNFTGATGVMFAGTPASFTVVGDTRIDATVPAGAGSGPIAVTTAGGTATSSAAFTVTVPDFALAATPPAQSVAAGGSTSYAVTVTPSGGFSGSVALSLSGLPAGTSASFSPATLAGSGTSTLTIQVAHNAKPGTSTLTITGGSGGTGHSTTVTLQIRKK
jgi:outer membrane protein assembly factor BamB